MAKPIKDVVLKGTNTGKGRPDQFILTEILEATSVDTGRAETRLEHTNDILDYFGFSVGEERNILLRTSGGGEHHLGADNIKKAYDLALDAGLAGQYEDTPAETRRIFTSITHSVYLIGKKATGQMLRNFGHEAVTAMLVGNYAPFLLTNGICLVPSDDLEGLTKKFGKTGKLTPRMMGTIGYQSQQTDGLPPVYTRQQT